MPLLPEKIEVKLAIQPEDTELALGFLGLKDPPNEEKVIHFLETGGLALFDRGLILRVRETVKGKDPHDVTLKVRGPGATGAAERFLKAEDDKTKFEGDQNVGKEELPSFSITTKPVLAALQAIAANAASLPDALDDAGRTLLQEIAGADAGKLTVLGPIRARIWHFERDGFEDKISAELWDVAGKQLLEISDKKKREKAGMLKDRLSRLFEGTAIRQLATSKTFFALTLLRKGPTA